VGGGTVERVEVTYELGFATPSGGWVRFASVPEAVVQAAEDNAKAAAQPDTGPTDLSQSEQPTEPAPADPSAEPEPVPAPSEAG
jgi:hypothetical protein